MNFDLTLHSCRSAANQSRIRFKTSYGIDSYLRLHSLNQAASMCHTADLYAAVTASQISHGHSENLNSLKSSSNSINTHYSCDACWKVNLHQSHWATGLRLSLYTKSQSSDQSQWRPVRQLHVTKMPTTSHAFGWCNGIKKKKKEIYCEVIKFVYILSFYRHSAFTVHPNLHQSANKDSCMAVQLPDSYNIRVF